MPMFTDPLCAEVGGDVFFPEAGTGNGQAKAICGSCIHNVECLDWAMRTGQRFGIFGGTTPWEREKLRAPWKRRGRPPGRTERDSRSISPETRSEMAERARITNVARAKRKAS